LPAGHAVGGHRPARGQPADRVGQHRPADPFDDQLERAAIGPDSGDNLGGAEGADRLIETDLRKAIAPARTIPALLPEGRAARPTAANIFAAFAGLGYQRARTSNGLEHIPDPLTPAQTAILQALNIPSILPTETTSRPRECGMRG
jgi:hypothetical protein